MLLEKGIKNSWYSIFYAVTKRTTNRQQTKNQLKFARKCFRSRKAYFSPQNMFYCNFVQQRYCIMWPLINENKQQLDIKKMQNYVLVFFRKKFISKDMKAINYEMKKLNRFVHSSKGSPCDLQLSRICLTSTKKNVKYDKNQKLFLFL